MKEKELRIGNFVEYEATTHWVTKILGNDIIQTKWRNSNHDNYNHNLNENWIRPIPINEECLLKFGFEKYEQDFTFKYSLLFIDYYIPKIPDYHYNGLIVRGNSLIHIKYIHQLQNLYFALTGEELEYQPSQP